LGPNVYDFLEGKISRIRIFLDADEALKAVGPAERAVPIRESGT
jgi:hypothetical protein